MKRMNGKIFVCSDFFLFLTARDLLYMLWFMCAGARTTDAQRGNGLHCTAENSLPLPNF